MKQRLGTMILGASLAMLLAVPVFADHGELTPQGNCPTDGKVDSVVDGDLDGIVLDAGTHVCIKAGSAKGGTGGAVFVTADGETNLRDLLGLDKEVSHYTIIETSTTTTEPEATTTTTEATTTTTLGTTTTIDEDTTTTERVDAAVVTTTTARATTTSVYTTEVSYDELPYTGVDVGWLALAAAVLAGTGVAIVRKVRA